MATAVNFFQPGTEGAIDANAIARQREMAKILAQQSLQGQPGQTVGGIYVPPSKLSYATQLAQALAGAYTATSADQRELALGQRIQAKNAADAQAFMQAANGTPASSREVAGPAMEGQPPPTQTTPAVPGDMNKALALALQSQNPLLQGMAPEIFKRQMDAAELQSALQGAGLGNLGGGNAPAGGGTGGIAGAPGAPVQAGFPQGNLPPGVNPQAVALTLSRSPQANKLGTMFQEAAKPNVLAEGGAIGRYNAQGQWVPDFVSPKTEAGIGVAPVPGQPGQFQANPVANYGAAKAAIAGPVAAAEAAARDPYAMPITVPGAAGPRLMTPAQVRAEAQGGAPQAQPPVRQGGPGVRGAFEGTAEQVMAAIDNSPVSPAVKAEMRTAYANQVSGNNPAYNDMGTGIPAGAMATGGASNPAGAATGGPNQAGAGRGVGIPLQTEQSQAYATARAKSYAEMAPKLQQAGQDAASTLRNLDTLETLYKDPNVAKGALAENISGLKNLGASFGIEMKGLSSEQAAEAITNKMALASRSTAEGGGMPGAMSDADRKFLANMQPGLTKTPEGRAKIIDASKKVAQRQIDMANMARQYEMEHGQLDLGFDKQLADYAAKNQMFTQPTKGGGSTTNINDLLNKYR